MHKVIVASFGRRVPKKKHLKLQARRQRVKKVMKMLRGVPKTHVLGQPYSVLCSRFMMDFNQNVQKPWVFEEIDFIGVNAMGINARPLTGAVTIFLLRPCSGNHMTFMDPSHSSHRAGTASRTARALAEAARQPSCTFHLC